MSTISRETVLHALQRITDPASGQDVVASGRVSGVVVRGGNVGFLVNTSAAEAEAMEPLRQQCEGVVRALAGVEKVTAVLTAEQDAATPASQPRQAAQWNRQPVEGIRHLLAVASGKGGVGKSTTTVCLARALQQQGLRVGILDADIYGPSIPLMMGLSGQPAIENERMVPLRRHDIACMSIGFLLGDEAAVLRAPMITKALMQMLRQVNWAASGEELDVLLIDMPPGTGDVHISLVQQAPLSGAVVVTTPQQVAMVDADKAVQMFGKVGVPVWGIIENMSYLRDASSGVMLYPFGQGGGRSMAAKHDLSLLAEVPLEPTLGAALDAGDLHDVPEAFVAVAQTLKNKLA
jgi:ATP-binding protein involved in chromosome partitioning